jgi:hypothetical protein
MVKESRMISREASVETLHTENETVKNKVFHESFLNFIQAIEPDEVITKDLVQSFLDNFNFLDEYKRYTSEYEEQNDTRIGL